MFHRLLIVATVAAWSLVAEAAEYVVPIMAEAPVIDGRVETEEWRVSAGFSGLAMNGQLERRQARAYVGATDDTFYFALCSQLPDDGEILAQVAVDTLKVVYDDSVEAWIDPTPGAESGEMFQMLANAVGKRGYKHHGRGTTREDPAWKGDWRLANGFHYNEWHCEIAVPIDQIAPGRKADQGTWGINLCRNWKQDWAFSSISGGAYAPEGLVFTLVDGAPAIHHQTQGDPLTGRIDTALELHNPADQPVTLSTEFKITRDLMPELATTETITLAAGETKRVGLQAQDESTRQFHLSLRVTSEDGAATHYERTYAWKAAEAWTWTVAKTDALPIDIQHAYYPYLNRMRVQADVSNLAENATLEKLTCVVRRKGETKAIKSVAFDEFAGPRQEIAFDLPPLEGEYELAATAEGDNVPEGELVKEFERTVYEWEGLGLGTSDEVYPPFTPIEVEGKRVSTVLRDHTMNDEGLWDQVTAAGEDLLGAPMYFIGLSALGALDLRVTGQEANEVVCEASRDGASVTSTWDYDGMMRVDLELAPGDIDELTLVIGLRPEHATMLHAMGDGIRNTLYEMVPEGTGVVWTSERVQANDLPANFCSYIYVGTPKRGLCWFAENDAGWGWDPSTPNVTITRSPSFVQVTIDLINQPTTITEPRTITFGLQAAPVKPMLGDWRYRWKRDNYTLLGTDINWFALGNCGAVYPAKKDLYLWEMLKRGNTEDLTDEEIDTVIERGRPYFAPYNREEPWERHVRYNLRGRRDKEMVLYYNRASYQLADEFQTFKDEWGLTDYRTVGKGDGIGEIKIVPTDSYIDHALYWYGKAFDVAGSKGVYWDNWFFVGSYNTRMTPAYARDDGSIMPSTGVWGLRELAKRTFVYLNERGDFPITMAHMTSTNILPMLSFCTVQYDWEWKYSQGDVQHRFPREYIQLVTTGELAGAWPVLLQDHGKLAQDPWTQRTFAGVCLVHELDGWGVSDVWLPLFEPVWTILDREGVEVYRYWDDRPQPVVADSPDLPTIIYSVPGEEAIFAVTSYAEEDVDATLTIDAKALGFGEVTAVTDTESGEELAVVNGALSLPIKKHDVRQFRILPGGAK
ncbi:MAG TPA: hypothetical protein QGH10_11740 [Armatimonadota bacterium]|nr:hypothetical protein [Armatimonadota bacterium]